MKKRLALLFVGTSMLQGCASMFTVGEEEFSCPGLPKGVVCEGPRAIMAMTDNHDSVTDYASENGGHTISMQDSVEHQHGNVESNNHDDHIQERNVARDQDFIDYLLPWTWSHEKEYIHDERTVLGHRNKGEVVYVERGEIQTPRDMTKPLTPQEAAEMARRQNQAQSLQYAPNARAVIAPPKVMRIYVAPYEDSTGGLNMPGYVYVEVSPKRWAVGGQAETNPARITPLQIRTRSLEEERANKKSRVNGLGVLSPRGN